MKVAVIPARGGSKRIPRKNIREFCGKPILAYSIGAAIKCGLFDRVIVSTDDDEIADIAKSFGAEIPFKRPSNFANDHTGILAVVSHAITALQATGATVDLACCVFATAPFVTPADLHRGLEILIKSGADIAFSVTSFSYPIQRAIKINAAGRIEMFSPEHYRKRSQDLEPAYHDAGQFYWGRSQAFLSDAPVFSERSAPVILPRLRVQDIDTAEDWERAELMFSAWQASGGQ